MNSFTRFSSTRFSNLPSTLKVVADNCAVGHGELALDVVFAGSGVAEHNRIRNRVLHLGENLGVGLGAGGQAGNAKASGLLLNTVVLAIWQISRSARYLAASGTML